MSKRIRFVINKPNVSRFVLKRAETDAFLLEKASAKFAELPDGYDMELHHFQKRDAVYIFPASQEAARDNWENHTLSRLL